MVPEDTLSLARSICIAAHEGQTDKAGKPYWMHPFYVASRFKGGYLQEVAYLHDVLEDSDVTWQDLYKFGFNVRVLDAVRAITKEKGEDYDTYIRRVQKDEIARLVKIEDLKHNMDISRIPNPTSKDYQRLEKYNDALEYLENRNEVS